MQNAMSLEPNPAQVSNVSKIEPLNCPLKFHSAYAKWSKIPVRISTQKGIPQIFVDATKQAIEAWNQKMGHTFFEFKGSSSNCVSRKVNCILLESKEGFLKLNESSDYGLTEQKYIDHVWSSADIVLNPKISWNHPASVGQVDPYDVILHELGHVLGIQHHFFGLGSVMNYVPYESGVGRQTITEFDVSVLKWLYFGGDCPDSIRMAFVDGQFDLAIDFYEQWEQKNQKKIDDVELIYLRSLIEKNKGRLDEAIKFADRSIDLSANLSDISQVQLLNHRGDLYIKKNKFTRALRDFNKSLRLLPSNYQTQTYIAFLRHKQGEDSAEIKSLLKSALEIKPSFLLASDLLKKLEP